MKDLFKIIIHILDKIHQRRIMNYIDALKISKIIDIGAHEGEFLSYALKLKKKKEIYCFEPQKKIF